MAHDADDATEQEVADLIGISRQALEQRRRRGTAPRHRKIGRTVVYCLHDVAAWMATRQIQTS